jgi:hypothetical protein
MSATDIRITFSTIENKELQNDACQRDCRTLQEGTYIVKLSENCGFEVADLVEEPNRWVWMHMGWDCGTECQSTDVVLEQIFVDEKTGILIHKPI